MARKGTVTSLLFLGIVIALGTLGLVFGLWSRTLDINGTVTTSGIDAHVQVVSVGDNETSKDIATCNATAKAKDDPDKPGGLNITISNAYPQYECLVEFNVRNNGKMPILVFRPNGVTTSSHVVVGIAQDSITGADLCYENPVQVADPAGKTPSCTMKVEILQDDPSGVLLPQNSDFNFSTTICYQQFNKSNSASVCKSEAKN